MNPSTDLSAVIQECKQFPGLFQSLHLATCNVQGEPEASYAAYVELDGCYYIYISELSAHTANLGATGRCSAMFIESETDASHLFARRRLTLQCQATESLRGSTEFERVLDWFEDKFGNFMGMLRKLSDFHLYRLLPVKGAYVAGFAKAYTLAGDGLQNLTHRKEQGHHSQDKTTADAMDAALTH